MLPRLRNLVKILVDSCDSVISIGLNAEEGFVASMPILPQLKQLRLRYLPKLMHTRLNQVSYGNCCYPNLMKIYIDSCQSLRNVFSLSVAINIVHLEELEVSNCEKMQEIIATRSGSKETLDKIEFPRLKLMRLESLQSLKSFWSSESQEEERVEVVDLAPFELQSLFNDKVAFPSLEELYIVNMELNNKWHIALTSKSFSKLRVLVVKSCGKLSSVGSLNLLQRLENLERLEISKCDSLEEVFKVEEDSWTREEDETTLRFHQLKIMRFEYLPYLRSFFSGSCILEFPSLKELSIECCGKLETIIPTINAPTQHFFNKKVTFPSLEKLYIKGMDELNNKWHNVLPTESFSKLRVLVLESCGKLLSVGPLNLLQRLENLQELEISKCGSLEEVFKVEEEETSMKIHDHTKREEETTLVFHQLKIMRFKYLPYLRSFYSGSCILEFPSLEELWIECCEKLEIIIPTINALTQHFFNKKATFPSLEELYIKGMDELNNKWHTALPTESFSKLRVLVVESCGKLLSIGPLNLLQRLENLQELEISKYGSLEEVFKVEEEETSMKIHDHTKREEETTLVFHQLKIMRFKHLPYVRSFYSGSCILEFPSLEELRIECCEKLETIFPTINAPTQYFFNKKVVLPGLKKLHLISLFNLREIGTGSLPLHFIQILEVRDCGNLRNLFSSSITTTLERLERLEIESCEVMEEIVASEGVEEVINQIVFPQLQYLQLSNLPNLTRFCNANYALNLPSLESARLERCMKMQAFAFGQGRDWQWKKKKQKMMHDNMQLRQLSR
ncbi:hypothetical protein F0562_011838 [Nyssa sinensis]|uniref:Disease resistance protein At4g27190-like leucine-rich repeats domain-containing protein n=1 Tax=Nyssa sinensis TaxID=561372 RepID=A0A5J4ZVK5_9ASTE|nr:hypothetical protein F0562_011838 [Nyssa sinensis]